MKVLVTGGTGFVGSRLTSFLRNSGNEVVLFKGDITKKEDFDIYKSSSIQAMIHLAGKIKGRNKKDFMHVNCLGTKNVVDFCRQQNISRLIFFSSIKVLSKLSDPYTDSKKAAEKIIIDSGVPYIIVRPSIVYGHGDDKNISLIIKLAKKLPVLPISNFKLQTVYIDDLIKIVSACLTVAPNQIFNIVGTETVSLKEILRVLKNNGIKTRPIFFPKIFNLFIKLLSFLPFSPLPNWQVKSILASEEFKGSNWPEIFNIKPTPFEKGIIKTIQWQDYQ